MPIGTDTLDARAASLSALAQESLSGEQAQQLEDAASMFRTVVDQQRSSTATLWRTYAAGLAAAGQLVRWDIAVRAAEPDAERWRRAATRNAGEALGELDSTDPTASTLYAALVAAQHIDGVSSVKRLLGLLRTVALPLPLLVEKSPRRIGRPPSDDPPTELPVAAAMIFFGGDPAVDAIRVRPSVAYDLAVRLSLTTWPDWATHLEVNILSVLGDLAKFPTLRAARPSAADADGLYTVSEHGILTVRVSRPLGSAPIRATIAVRLVGTDRALDVPVAGLPELRLLPHDYTQDELGGGPQLYEHVAAMLAELDGSNVPHEDQLAFRRFFLPLVRVSQQMLAARVFPAGGDVSERDFQAEMRKRLELTPELAGRIDEGTETAGGETDLSHDGIVCENKVARTKTPTLDSARSYLGQPITYANAFGRSVSILCILDQTTATTPPGILANYIGWLKPRAHGLDDPQYPSRIAVVIIPANLPLPSELSGKPIPTAPTEPPDTQVVE